jgi:hypothetical protein
VCGRDDAQFGRTRCALVIHHSFAAPGGVTQHPLTFAEKQTAAWIGRFANRTVANVTATAPTPYGRMHSCGPGLKYLVAVRTSDIGATLQHLMQRDVVADLIIILKYISEIGRDLEHWIHLAQGRNRWRAHVNTVVRRRYIVWVAEKASLNKLLLLLLRWSVLGLHKRRAISWLAERL